MMFGSQGFSAFPPYRRADNGKGNLRTLGMCLNRCGGHLVSVGGAVCEL